MHVEHIDVLNFRNLQPLKLQLPPSFIVLTGNNGQGKTNVLEALYVAATGRSFRHATPSQLLQHGASYGHVMGIFERQSVRHKIEVAISPERRQIRVDERFVRQHSQLLQLVNVVAFFPDDLRIIKGSPEQRRNFLDRVVGNFRPDFVHASIQYQKALKARNALLRTPGVNPSLLEVYDEQLLHHGTVIDQCRRETLTALLPNTQQFIDRILKEQSAARLQLQSGLKHPVQENFGEQFRRELLACRAQDLRQGITHVGPHRADVTFELLGHDAQVYASQGQQRAFILALKLAELTWLRAQLQSAPVLLLDDVSSELDSQRSAEFFGVVENLQAQVWLSTTGAAALPLPRDTFRLSVEAGRVSI